MLLKLDDDLRKQKKNYFCHSLSGCIKVMYKINHFGTLEKLETIVLRGKS
jgi:hypothetical protein